ncbi:hypothetical protein [Kitasatospora sp. NBC_01302]|uniref:hypothetical protein n=1 Tax=Kitasatospora sp. NBC_01302 TaxID=2903575 RepID=UPI002E13BD64|nr:hypothetical protein OG294_14035 [Kitasatospora sp. NBC_01302]
MFELLVGAALAASTYGAGVLTGRHQRRNRTPAEICQCAHGSAFHDATGCHHIVKGQGLQYRDGVPIKWERVECPCVRYVGPLSSYIPELDAPAKEITP